MKRLLLVSLSLTALTFLLPLLFLGLHPETAEAGEEERPAAEATASPAEGSGEGRTVLDADIPLRVLGDEGVYETTLADYLPLALAAEMPASFEAEALKAQAVALRSYALYAREHTKSAHPEADLCASPGCCAACTDWDSLRERWGDGFAAYAEKLRRAVSDTDGQYLVYDSEAILAVFHASSVGATESGGALWSELPYLQSVSTPESAGEVKNLVTTVEVSGEEFRSSLAALYPAADFSGGPEGWLGEWTYTGSGRVASVEVGGAAVSGAAMRAAFSLRSTDFDLAWENGRFVFTVRGYGHGVGMSQYGANVMAKGGSGYGDILAHYYPGTELVVAVRYEN